jgi:adenosylcobinamide kinase/adenosylcobinamide-phosphate guanylyltransferase
MLVTNLILEASPDVDQPDEAAAARAVETEIDALLQLMRQSDLNWIVVTNEVGLGLVPPYPLGRLFRDLLGWANQRLAAEAGEVYLLVSGIALPVHPYR